MQNGAVAEAVDVAAAITYVHNVCLRRAYFCRRSPAGVAIVSRTIVVPALQYVVPWLHVR